MGWGAEGGCGSPAPIYIYIYIYLSLSLSLSIYLSIYLPTYLSIYLSIYLSMCVCVCVCVGVVSAFRAFVGMLATSHTPNGFPSFETTKQSKLLQAQTLIYLSSSLVCLVEKSRPLSSRRHFGRGPRVATDRIYP